MNTLTVVYLDVINNDVQILDIENDLHVFYDMIQCRCVEMPERRIGKKNKYFTIICDEEALLKENPKPSAIDNLGSIMLCGNLIICGIDWKEGDLISLTYEDAQYIKKHVQLMSTINSRTGKINTYYMLTQCEY